MYFSVKIWESNTVSTIVIGIIVAFIPVGIIYSEEMYYLSKCSITSQSITNTTLYRGIFNCIGFFWSCSYACVHMGNLITLY